jgi:hypothetical protein
MFREHLARTIEIAPANHLDELAREIWAAHRAGALDDQAAQTAAEAIRARQRAAQPLVPIAFKAAQAAFPRSRRQRSPDRQASIERRRRLAASGGMPPAIAAHFTTGEAAVLRIVGDEVRVHGCCALHLDAIAARAGVCRSTARNAIATAQRLGFLARQERRRRGQPSLTNILTIVSPAWLGWIRLKGGGGKNSSTTDNRGKQQPAGGVDKLESGFRCDTAKALIAPNGPW